MRFRLPDVAVAIQQINAGKRSAAKTAELASVPPAPPAMSSPVVEAELPAGFSHLNRWQPIKAFAKGLASRCMLALVPSKR